MKSAMERRTIQCLIDGQWVTSDISQLEYGDVFRILNPQGIVILFNGKEQLVFRKHFTLVDYCPRQHKEPKTWIGRLLHRLSPPVAI